MVGQRTLARCSAAAAICFSARFFCSTCWFVAMRWGDTCAWQEMIQGASGTQDCQVLVSLALKKRGLELRALGEVLMALLGVGCVKVAVRRRRGRALMPFAKLKAGTRRPPGRTRPAAEDRGGGGHRGRLLEGHAGEDAGREHARAELLEGGLWVRRSGHMSEESEESQADSRGVEEILWGEE